MVRLPDRAAIQTLSLDRTPHGVSLYVERSLEGGESGQQRIMCKNLLRKASEMLDAAGATEDEIHSIMLEGRELLDDPMVWSVQHAGVVIFLSYHLVQYFHVPDSEFSNIVAVQRGFHTYPIEQELARSTPYYLLALGYHDVRLYRGDRYHLELVHLRGLPDNMEQALRIDEVPNWRELHAVASADRGKGSEAYHGQLESKNTDKQMLARFLQAIDSRLGRYLRSQQGELLIVAGASYVQSLYQKVNTYKYMIPVLVRGNVAYESIDTLRHKAVQALTRYQDNQRAVTA